MVFGNSIFKVGVYVLGIIALIGVVRFKEVGVKNFKKVFTFM